MSVYYRLFWQDIQFKSTEMKEKERERGEREKKWISGDGGGGALVSNTHTQITINSNTHRATGSPLEPSGNHFFLLALSLSL